MQSWQCTGASCLMPLATCDYRACRMPGDMHETGVPHRLLSFSRLRSKCCSGVCLRQSNLQSNLQSQRGMDYSLGYERQNAGKGAPLAHNRRRSSVSWLCMRASSGASQAASTASSVCWLACTQHQGLQPIRRADPIWAM